MAEEQKKPATVELPDLKKQERERKKAGVAWQGGGTGGAPFTGATGGSGAAAAGAGGRAAAAAARAGAAGMPGAGGLSGEISGGIFTRLAQLVARVTATWTGKVAATAAVAVALGAGAYVAVRAFAPAIQQDGGPDLGALSSSINIYRGGASTALDYAARAARGMELAKGPAAGKPDQAGPVGEAAKDAPPAGDAAKAEGNFESRPGEGANRDLMENNLSGAKLSTSLGGSTFGGKDIFARAESPSKFGEALRGSISRLSFGALDKGRSGRMKANQSRGSRAMALGRRGVKSSKALAQLRGMQTLNAAMRSGGRGAGETQSAAATTQFEGSTPIGGSAPTAPVDGRVPANLPGNTPTDGYVPNDISGACTQEQINEGWISDGNTCVPQIDVSYDDKTPWKQMVEQARTILIIATIMTLIAGILGLLGQGFLATGCSAYVGVLILAIVRVLATIIGILLGGALIFMGNQIAQMGGGKQGSVFVYAGTAVMIGAAMTIFGNIYPIATMVGMFAAVVGAALGL